MAACLNQLLDAWPASVLDAPHDIFSVLLNTIRPTAENGCAFVYQNKHSISDQFPDTVMASQQIMQQKYYQTEEQTK